VSLLKPRELERRAQKELEKKGYKVVRAMASGRFINGKYITHYNDFFNVFDLIAVKDNEVRFIQITSGEQLSSHKSKVKANFNFSFKNTVTIEIWYYYKLKGKWQYKILYLKDGEWLDSKL